MSWDISVFAAKVPPPPVAEMPADWRGETFGAIDNVRRKISICLPAVDWSDPTWGKYDGDGFSLEFNVGDKESDEQSDGFMVHVRGGGDAATTLLALGRRWGWYLLDCSQGEWLHHCADVEAGWKGFQTFRDRVLDRSESDGEPST